MTPRNAWKIGIQKPQERRESSEIERECLRAYAEVMIERAELERLRRLRRLLWPRRYR